MKSIDISHSSLHGSFYKTTNVFYLNEGKIYRYRTTSLRDISYMGEDEAASYRLSQYPIGAIFQSFHLQKGENGDFPPLVTGGLMYEQWYLDSITLDRTIQDKATRESVTNICLPFFNYEDRLCRMIFKSYQEKGTTFEFEMLSNTGSYVPIIDNLGFDPVLIDPKIT